MKKDIEHVVTSTAMFLIAFIVSSKPEPEAQEPRRRQRASAPSIVWFIGVALVIGALVWTTNSYVEHLAFCQHLRLTAPALPLMHPNMPPPPSLEYVDLSALGIEAILLTAFVFFAIRTVRRRRLSRRSIR